MTTQWKRRVTALRFLLAILVAHLPLQPLYAQLCCQDETAAQHAEDAGSAAHVDSEASDCCCCCDNHHACGNGESCASSACSHASQFMPALAFDAFVPPVEHPSTGPPGLHSDSPPHQKTKPPRILIA